MTEHFIKKAAKSTLPIVLVKEDACAKWLKSTNEQVQNICASYEFTGKEGQMVNLPGKDGKVAAIAVGIGNDPNLWSLAGLPAKLPAGSYQIDKLVGGRLNPDLATDLAIGWALGRYRFEQYKSDKGKQLPKLVFPDSADRTFVDAKVAGICLTRDLINVPTNDMGPAQLAEVAKELVKGDKRGKVKLTVGDQLLQKNFPAIHAVGRAAGQGREPRLIDLTWGDKKHPMITLVGKGVCFDTGGLNIKTGNYMRQMKKDMGGAAQVLGLAKMIMALDMQVRLRVLIPAVENSISGEAYRPGDVIDTRKGVTVEIDNTDAEGRVVLADALALACEEKPDLLVDFATLTGAARVAVGTEIAAFFTDDDVLARGVESAGKQASDDVWRLPMHQPYESDLSSSVADTMNSGGGYAGATTAALFLKKFVEKNISWAHFDIMAWNIRARPGRPVGGEAMGVSAMLHLLQQKFGGGKKPQPRVSKSRKHTPK